MNFKSFSKIAAVSAIAMTLAMHAAGVVAAPYIIGQDVPVPFTATVDNTIDVVVTAGNFGTIAAMNSTAAGDVATATLTPGPGAQVLVDEHSTGFNTAAQAHIVGQDSAPGAAAIVDVTAAFESEEMFVTFGACTDLAGPGTEELVLSAITTSLGGATYDCTTPLAAGHTFTTTAGGTGQFYVGASISTDGTTDAAYTDGAYAGAVQMQITY